MESMRLDKLMQRCPNYNRIINYNYMESDLLTHQLINLYQEYILSTNMTECELITCEIYDNIIKEYLDNRKFHNFIKKHYENGHFEDFIMKDKIIELYDQYQNEHLRLVEETKWL